MNKRVYVGCSFYYMLVGDDYVDKSVGAKIIVKKETGALSEGPAVDLYGLDAHGVEQHFLGEGRWIKAHDRETLTRFQFDVYLEKVVMSAQ